MTRIASNQAEREALISAAALLAVAARTAPKARAVDNIETLIVTGEDQEHLADAMEQCIAERPQFQGPSFKRDAENVRRSGCVLLVGVRAAPKKIEKPLDCGACGYPDCAALARAKKRTRAFTGPVCIQQALDLGIALGSVVASATALNLDNRIMYTVGAGARELGWLSSELILGIPLSVSGKNIFFDRTLVPK